MMSVNGTTRDDSNAKMITLATPDELRRFVDAPNRKTVTFGSEKFVDDWDEELFISENCYEQFLSAVQQGRCPHPDVQAVVERRLPYDEDTIFEGYLRDMLKTCKWRREELKREQARGFLTQHYRQQALEPIEKAEGAIIKYLEKREKKRLIGV